MARKGLKAGKSANPNYPLLPVLEPRNWRGDLFILKKKSLAVRPLQGSIKEDTMKGYLAYLLIRYRISGLRLKFAPYVTNSFSFGRVWVMILLSLCPFKIILKRFETKTFGIPG